MYVAPENPPMIAHLSPSCRKAGPIKIGYARVSTVDQNPAMQHDALCAAGCSTVFTDDGVSAVRKNRPGLTLALRRLKPGDVFVVWKIDRAFRSANDALRVLGDLIERGVDFVSLTENIDTSQPIGRMLYGLLAIFAEFEREQMRARTLAGLDAARRRGSRIGRPPKLSTDQIAEARRLYRSGNVTYEAIGKSLGVSGITVSRAVNRAPQTDNEGKEGRL